ncbi:MAG: hypothetical protein ACI8RC_003089, partial [Ilumatobacter sp.]
ANHDCRDRDGGDKEADDDEDDSHRPIMPDFRAERLTRACLASGCDAHYVINARLYSSNLWKTCHGARSGTVTGRR